MVPPAWTTSAVPDRLRRRLAELRAAGPSAGRAWCLAWTDAVDGALTELHGGSVHRERLTVAAVGGYGRQELCPWSDIDLLLLHDDLEGPALEVAVRQIVYPLWDAGITVGYAVRSRREAVSVREVDDVTATLDARAVAGSPALVAAVRGDLVRNLRRNPRAFLRALADADAERHARRGDAAEVLEPDLKNGAGGLRDVQSLRWAAAALVGEARLDALVSAAYLGAADRARLAHAYGHLLAERVALHLSSRSAGDVLGFDHQDTVAEALGYADGSSERDTRGHRLLTDHFLAARVIDHVHRRAWALMRSDVRRGRRRRRTPDRMVAGFPVADGVLQLPDRERLDDAELPTRLLAALASSRAVLSRDAAQRLRRAAESADAPLAWTPTARDRFVRTLWLGEPGLHAAIELDDAGLLTALLPEWRALRGRPQRNPYHRFSLDRHALHAAAALGELVRHEEWAASTLEEVEDRDALLLGTLLHDVGKAHGEPHAETGRAVARSVLERVGLDPPGRALVDRMVRLHLLLPRTATRRDLSDPEVIAGVAREVGDRQTLAALHLLAAADGLATGPSAWSDWTAALVARLVASVRVVLQRRGGDDLADRAVATARGAQALAVERGVDPDLVRSHLAGLPTRYAIAVTADVVVRHAELAGHVTDGRPTVAVEDTEGDGGRVRLLVAAPDRPGLLALVAGAVTRSRGSVVEAHAHTRVDGIALQALLVAPPDPPEPDWRERLVVAIGAAHDDPAALARDLERRRGYSRPAPAPTEVPTRVTVDHTSRATLVEVRTHDRPGLLHLAASVLTGLDYDIDSVKAVVQGPVAVDAFTVRRRDGRPADGDAEAELELALLAAVGSVDERTSPAARRG